jgi:uncharacterized protein (TIGR03435 family)
VARVIIRVVHLKFLVRLVAPAALACTALAQTPAFEVASVKPSEPITPAMVQAGRLNIGVSIDALNVRISKFSLFDLTILAYQVKPYQVTGPQWMATARYDIQAKLPEGGKRGQVPAMLQTLLAERFGMQIHRERREFNVYALVAAKGGNRLKPAAPEDAAVAPPPQIRGGIAVGPGGAMVSTAPGGDCKITPGQGGNLHLECKRITMARLADNISRYFERPLIDMTGIDGAYEIEFDVSGEEVRAAARAHGVALPPPADPAAAEAAADPSGVSLASSLQRLGLKIESRKTPAEVIVVDKAEKVPTEN